MHFNEMELKAYYEMKKEEMEKAVLASRYSKKSPKSKLYSHFFNMFKKGKTQKILPKSVCCEIKLQEVCCGN